MAEEQLPLTDPYFATEDKVNIAINTNDQIFPMPMDPPTPVAQEDARPHPETDQLVSSTLHMPRWRRDNGEMLCVLAPSPIDTAPNTPHLLPHTLMGEQRRVLLEDMLPLPSQDTTHQGGSLDLLVCAPSLRPCGVQILSGTVLRSLARNEEWAEVVCVDGGGERTSQSVLHHTSNTTEPSSEVEISFGVMDITEHSPHYYILPQQKQLPLETANTCIFIEPNINLSYSCMDTKVECTHNSSDPVEDEQVNCNTAPESPIPPTQQLVTGRK